MESAAVLATPAYQHFDKGIRARALGDQLSAIVGVTNLLKENPFPNLVNQVALRLADAFKDGNNKVRTCIARVLDDSSEHLSLIFSSEEVLKRIFVVSHSNDPVSKALTLEVLGKLAHLYVETKKVHHLILESLTTEHDFEFECAVRAMTAFAKISSEFSAATVERIAVLLTSSEVAMERKILIVSTVGTMKADVKAAKECFGLEKFLLEHSSNTNLVCTLLTDMTSLAKSTRYAIPMQVEILLDAAINADSHLGVRLAALSELIILAKYAHLWEEHHLKKLHELKTKVEQGPAMILNKYLRILTQISSRIRVNHAVFLQEILFELGYLFTSQQIAQRILSIQFACNIYIYHPDPPLAIKLVHAFTITAGLELKKGEAGRFYATLARFLCSPSVSQEYIQSLLGPLLESSLDHPHAKHVVQLLCRVADRLPAVAPAIKKWTTHQLGSLSNPAIYTSDLREELVFLLLIPTVEVASTSDLVAEGSDWDRYTTARTAFRNGHWNNAAHANLIAINTSSLSFVHKYWIEVLIKLASSQMTFFSVTNLQEQRDSLTFAHAKTVELVEFLPSPAFIFAKNYIEAMLTVSNALHSFICGVASITRFDSHFTDPASLYRVRTALQSFSKSLEKCDGTWTALYRKAFTADASTLDSLTYVHTSCVIVLIGVKKLLKDANIRDVMMPNLQKETAISIGGRERLVWAKDQVAQLGPLSEASFKTWSHAMEALFTLRQSIPRYIFHQEYNFTIKLNVSSAVNGEMTVIRNQNVPIQIDGFIETNHPTKIDSVIITSAVHYFALYANNTSFTSNIKLNGETHFSTQLMLCFSQSCNMEFAIEFVDSQKRTWSTSVKSKVKVMINE